MISKPVNLIVEAATNEALRPMLVIHNGPRTTRLALTWQESRELRSQLEAAERMAGLLSDVETDETKDVLLPNPVTIYKNGPRTVRARLTQKQCCTLRAQLKTAQRNGIKRIRRR